MAQWYPMLASVFDGCGGSCGDLCDGRYHYAELGVAGSYAGTAVGIGNMAHDFGFPGQLPCGFPVTVSLRGRTFTATKGDIGYGDTTKLPNAPDQRRIDLHRELATALGFSGLETVMVSPQGSAGGAPAPAGPPAAAFQSALQLQDTIEDENWAGWVWNCWKTILDQAAVGYYGSATAANEILHLDKFVR